ncbi:3-phosphoshikimate 1-carboxyvinyltransferase [Deinococcus peraridilitoris]|uniref:3-phosphoshikimate 1-carboxyvinyltransferase n=1 Tax=Deinococcus peraridilitoris (strain DSM 19664 / LMG 22246 / CIP 109416 / KR-200) TaxID=937777 RepID=L0A580_DEIPD|nr:3-phosphoshikimate 1-carboxyvinyltransferase [Deinococcus peraridilitoris]AFZ68337.1 3-phosphoshikimate 1-carboxyvinyltransferase [Deinococcus peraridilitoris DSM 19664]
MNPMTEAFDVTVMPARELRGEITAQPSKNYTTRFLLAAALSSRDTLVRRPATSEDSLALQRCLQQWGALLTPEDDGLRVRGFGASPKSGELLDPGNAGAVVRFLIAISALARETRFETAFTDSLGKRPQGDLLDALRQLGADLKSEGGRLPVTVRGGQLRGGQAEVSAERSSQFASALLFLGPLLPEGLDLHLTGHLKSHAALRQTLATLRTFGIEFEASEDLRRVQLPGGQRYESSEVTVPGDYPGSSAILVAGTIVPGEIRLRGLQADDLQGERETVDVLREMGATLSFSGDVVTVHGGSPLSAVTRDGDRFTDAVQALCGAAAFARGTSTWENVYTLRLKECDRISDTRRELQKLGLEVSETQDSLSVTGRESLPGGVTVDGHGDHRMIMLLTLIGLHAQAPITIIGAHHIRKSYPDFFRHLEALGARFEYHALSPA